MATTVTIFRVKKGDMASQPIVGPLKISYWLLLDARGAADGKAKADGKVDGKADYTDGKVDGNNADGTPTARSNPTN